MIRPSWPPSCWSDEQVRLIEPAGILLPQENVLLEWIIQFAMGLMGFMVLLNAAFLSHYPPSPVGVITSIPELIHVLVIVGGNMSECSWKMTPFGSPSLKH